MDPQAFLDQLRASGDYRGQIVHHEIVPPRDATVADPVEPLPPLLREVLAEAGIAQLYAHQATFLDAVRRGHHTVLIAGTAGGKSLAYHLPVLERLLEDDTSTALYLFPTKALAQDQLHKAARLVDSLARRCPAAASLAPRIYDGDLGPAQRRAVRDEARIVFSNPDMIHRHVIPKHMHWARFLSGLRFIVVDELHSLRGLFGTQCSLVFRRLNRVCERHGATPRYLCGTATIANPVEHATRLTDRPMHLVDNDGSPRGRMEFVFWNPPPLKQLPPESGTVGFAPRRQHGNIEAQALLTRLVKDGFHAIAFTKSWTTAELLTRYVRESAGSLGDKVASYRGGYLAERRREIEQALFQGELAAVVSTNALELGLDIGAVDSVVIVGYPGTISSTWQQAGRAGRAGQDALVFFVGYDTPINQYLMTHPDFFFSRSPEHALVNPHNPYALADHLLCSCHEIPLSAEEAAADFGADAPDLLELLEGERQLKAVRGRYYSTAPASPALQVSLRSISRGSYAVLDQSSGETLCTVDEIRAYPCFHPGAIYLHEDRTWEVQELDTDEKVARVQQVESEYYTDPLGGRGVRRIDTREEALDLPAGRIGFGEVTAEFRTGAFRKIRFWDGKVLETVPLDLPPRELNTSAFWLEPGEAVIEQIQQHGRWADDATQGLGHAFMTITSLFAMCHTLDVRNSPGWSCEPSAGVHRNTVFLFDNYQGGMGYAELAFQRMEQVLESTRQLIVDCPCEAGCPACVGYFLRPVINFDPDTGEGMLPDKESCLLMLHGVQGLEYEPFAPPTGRKT